MPLVKNLHLILVNAEPIEFQNDEGQKIRKWKYLFMQQNSPDLLEAYDDVGVYKDDVQVVINFSWDEKLAKDYPFQAKVFQGKTTWKLLSGLPAIKERFKK